MFIARRKYDSWTRDLELEQERDRQARYEAERGTEEAKRRTEEIERVREENRRLFLEWQKKMIVRLFKKQFGADAELPENWAEGRSCDDLDILADKIDELANLQEALELFQ